MSAQADQEADLKAARRVLRFAGEALSALSRAGLEGVRVMPWPGEGIPAPPPSDPALAADLADGTLASRLIVARAS